MYLSKKVFGLAMVFILALGALSGFLLTNVSRNVANAQVQCVVDESLLTRIYGGIFHRPLDAGAGFHLGKNLDTVLNDIANSAEHTQYSGMFKAMKAFEEAKRAPGELSQADKDKYLNLLDSALTTVSAWSDTLPEQALDNAVIGPDQARLAIQNAYEMMNAIAQQNAQFGLFQALENLGPPQDIAGPDVAPSHSVGLREQNNSGVSGTAVMSQVDGKTKIVIDLTGTSAYGASPVHIHSGSCSDLGVIVHPLNNVVNGRSDTTLAVGAHELFAQLPWAINVHKSADEINVYVACVDMTL